MVKEALEAQKKAYAPYSKFHVGAAVKAKNHDKIYQGCNVENGSFGATVCAERVAIFSMIAGLGEQKLESVVVATPTSPPSPPCALCLQVISEFSDDCEITLVNSQGEREDYTLSDFLPKRFDFNKAKRI